MKTALRLLLAALLSLPGVHMLLAQCSPPPKRTLLIAADAGIGRDTVVFGHHPLATAGQDTIFCERELPPPPPIGVFDFRFVNPPGREGLQPPGGMGQGFYVDYRAQTSPVQSDTHRVRLQAGSGGHPVTFSWSPAGITAIYDSAWLMDEFGGIVAKAAMHTVSTLVVTSPSVPTLLLITFGTLEPPSTPSLVAPADGATDLPTTLSFFWSPSTQARTYRLQISADSLFGAPVVDDSTLTSNSGEAGGLTPGMLYFWRVRAVNGAGAGLWSAVRRFVTVALPGVPILLSPADNADRIPLTAILMWRTAPAAARYRVQVGADSLFGTLAVDTSEVTDTMLTTPPLGAGARYFWRVRGENGAGPGPWSVVRRFVTLPVITFPLQLQEGWNMLSLPVVPADRRTEVLFPGAGSRAYAFEPTGYVARDTLRNGEGYFLKFPAAGSTGITGVLQIQQTITLSPGWNLFGTVGEPVPAAGIGQFPPGVVLSPFYGFNGSYEISDTLQAGRSYWVKAASGGTLTIPAGPVFRPAHGKKIGEQ